MDERDKVLDWQSLFELERKRIATRRMNAGLTKCGNLPTRKDDLVGLALSGGGVRSAMFNLGLIQALHRSGILRYVDYLSSVSGGSYIAGHVASQAVVMSKQGVQSCDENEQCPPPIDEDLEGTDGGVTARCAGAQRDQTSPT